MVIELTTDNAIAIASIIGSVVFGVWARSVSAHNKLSEERSAALKKDIDDIQKANESLRDCLQETREEYVTTARFDALFNEIKADIKEILRNLASKHDKADCRECRFPLLRKEEKHD